MLVAENDEITTLSSIARDDVVAHREWTATKQTSLRGAKRRGNLMLVAENDEIATLCSR